jgi:hypothetical protein
VFPANAALGINGCQDCHHPDSDLFYASILQYPFDEYGKSVTSPQYSILGLSKFMVFLSTAREFYVKPLFYFSLIFLICVLLGLMFKEQSKNLPSWLQWRFLPLSISIGAVTGVVVILFQPKLVQYTLPSQFWLNANHFIISIAAIAAGFWIIKSIKMKYRSWILGFLLVALILGLLILLRLPLITFLTRISYTIFDLAIVVLTIGLVLHFTFKILPIKPSLK